MDKLSNYQWQDTGESLTDYRWRIFQNHPAFLRYLIPGVVLAGILIGGSIGFFSPEKIQGVLIGSVCGALASLSLFMFPLFGENSYRQR